MKYVNTATVQKLVTISRMKKFVGPGETVELSTIDINMLGANAQFIVPFSKVEEVGKVAKKAAKEKIKVKKEIKVKVIKKTVKKDSTIKKSIKKAIEKISKKSKKKKS